LLPRGVPHIYTLVSVALSTDIDTVRLAALFSSLPFDYVVRIASSGHITEDVTDALPWPEKRPTLEQALLLRTLRLNCLTELYKELWAQLFDPEWRLDRFVAGDSIIELGAVDAEWSKEVPLRSDLERWLALCEVDAIAALLVGISADQLTQMYRSNFAVLRKNEHQMVFDGNGKQICRFRHAYGVLQADWEADLKAATSKRGDKKFGMWDRVQAYLGGDTATDLGPFVPPFRPADREAAMRRAHRAFSERLEAEES
jgi:hypothetical protein